MFGPRGFGGGFGPPPIDGRSPAGPRRATSERDECAPIPPPPVAPVHHAARVRAIDAFYAALLGAEILLFERETRVPFVAVPTPGDPKKPLLQYQVPAGQVLIVSDVEFYAQRPNPLLAGDQLEVEKRQLQGYVALHLLVDGRAPYEQYADISAPIGLPDTMSIRGSTYTALGYVLGGSERQPGGFLVVRDNETLQLGYTVVSPPPIVVDHVGAVVRGYLIPAAVFAVKTGS